ncbi:hypothetical protein B0H10DRAFT_2227683 [Mycena sp. CBHHK59/15]|nr:hypothetical protein B0H10DRAFT_2227683 [Mycena sp. CBHHK59/15]
MLGDCRRRAVEVQMAQIEAALMCGLVTVSIMWSEFDEVEQMLNAIITHLHAHVFFSNALAATRSAGLYASLQAITD